MNKYDLAIIGAGPAGNTAALDAAALGKKIICIDKGKLGGTCLNKGCIPTKAIIESASAYKKAKDSAHFGVNAETVSFDYSIVKKRSEEVVERLGKGVEFLFKKAGVEFLNAEAKIVSENKIIAVSLDGISTEIFADKILICTGAKQKRHEEFFKVSNKVISSEEALKLDAVPQSVMVVGAGAIGLEFAWIWNSFGAKVILIEAEKNILPSADDEISRNLERALKKQGIAIKTAKFAKSLVAKENLLALTITDASSQEEVLETEYLLWACGMEAQQIEAENLKFNKDKNGFLLVDENYETSVKNIYAIGDSIGAPMLAHAAISEAHIVIEKIFSPKNSKNLGAVPMCVYTSPQVASVGKVLDKENSAELKLPYLANGKAVAIAQTEGLIKISYDKQSGKILAAHILGAEASELISNFVIAIDKELTVKDFAEFCFPHPTISEIITDAASM